MNTVKFIVLLAIVTLSMVSCNETERTEVENVSTIEDLQTRYGSRMIVSVPLTKEAQDAVLQWSVFDDFQENVYSLKNQTTPALQARTEQLQQQADSLLKKIPPALDSKPIVERMILVTTRIKLLHQQVQRPQIDSLQLENSLYEMGQAVQNLFVQINGAFNKNKIDEELRETELKELEQQQRFRDSVFQQELEDNNNNG